ncbi:MAG: DUF2970 domain-containing protein [Steroidobacteraceae bacterium]|jgi:hypothetical protein
MNARERRTGNALQTARAVAWALFGVRNSREHQKDVSQLKPLHLIAGGVIAAMLFVGALLLLVNWVIRSGVAA